MRTKLAHALTLSFLLPILTASAADVKVTYTFADKHVETSTHPLVQDGAVERFRLKAADIPRA